MEQASDLAKVRPVLFGLRIVPLQMRNHGQRVDIADDENCGLEKYRQTDLMIRCQPKSGVPHLMAQGARLKVISIATSSVAQHQKPQYSKTAVDETARPASMDGQQSNRVWFISWTELLYFGNSASQEKTGTPLTYFYLTSTPQVNPVTARRSNSFEVVILI